MSNLHWLAPINWIFDVKCYLITCKIVFFMPNHCQQLLTLPIGLPSDFRAKKIRQRQRERSTESLLSTSSCLSLLSLSLWPRYEPAFTASSRKHTFFILLGVRMCCVWVWKMKWNAADLFRSRSITRPPLLWNWWPEFDSCVCQIPKITNFYKEIKEKGWGVGIG